MGSGTGGLSFEFEYVSDARDGGGEWVREREGWREGGEESSEFFRLWRLCWEEDKRDEKRRGEEVVKLKVRKDSTSVWVSPVMSSNSSEKKKKKEKKRKIISVTINYI